VGAAAGTSARDGRPFLLALATGAVYAAGVGTQFVAYKLSYHPNLGTPVFAVAVHQSHEYRLAAAVLAAAAVVAATLGRRLAAIGPVVVTMLLGAIAAMTASLGPLYAPYRVILWAHRYEHVRGVAEITGRGLWVTVIALVGVWIVMFIARPRHQRPLASSSHGSARWGDPRVLAKASGLILGRLPVSEARSRRDRNAPPLLRYERDGHLLTVAPTRSGKGVGCVIPNLLSYGGSVVVTDPKGENFAVTARQRRAMGQAVYVLDPFGTVRDTPAFTGSAALNPLDLVEASSPDALDDARLLADMLVVPCGRNADQSFWDEEARALLTGLILHVAAAAPPELRNLPHVRELLTLPPDPFALVLEDMLASDACDGLVARAAARLMQKAERERSSVISAAQSHTHFLDSPRMASVLAESTVPLDELRSTPTSVYLVLPPSRLDGYSRWLRLMIACALSATTRRAPTASHAASHRVLFLLDEFAHLGRMQPVERGIGLAAGYGVTFWILLQDLAQLRATYPDRWATFLANCEVLQAFGTNDWETAEHLSKLTGEATIQVASENRSRGVSRGQHAQRNEGEATTLAERGRRLMTADEVLRMPGEEALLFMRGQPAVRAQRMDYRAIPELYAAADPNPMHSPQTLHTPLAVSDAS
jgi:type IV secretion system protein VirD4